METQNGIDWDSFSRAVSALATAPLSHVAGDLGGVAFRAEVGIRDYDKKIAAYYEPLPLGNLDSVCLRAGIPFSFRHFGVVVRFETPVRLACDDQDWVLRPQLKDLVARFGPVVLKNAQAPSSDGTQPQRNIFPHLNFHVDRTADKENQYSFYSRDPNDPAQVEPRGSSTLFIANIAAHLQALREGVVDHEGAALKSLYRLFEGKGEAERAFDQVIFNHAWDEPAGTGELVMIDNRTVLHASYHRPRKGWPIGTRYLY